LRLDVSQKEWQVINIIPTADRRSGNPFRKKRNYQADQRKLRKILAAAILRAMLRQMLGAILLTAAAASSSTSNAYVSCRTPLYTLTM